MKKRIQQQIIQARSKWLRLNLSLKNPKRWIPISEMYHDYKLALAKPDTEYHMQPIDAINREAFRKWVGWTVDFVEWQEVPVGKNGNLKKREYRMKIEKECPVTSLGKKVAKLGRYLFNGKCSSAIQNQSK